MHATILENRIDKVVPIIVSAPHRPVDQGEYQPNLQRIIIGKLIKLFLKEVWWQTMGTGIEAQAVRGLHCLRDTSLCACGKRITKDQSKNFDITDNYSLVDQNHHTLKEMNKEIGVGGRLLVVIQQAPE